MAKRITAALLCLWLCFGLFTGCASQQDPAMKGWEKYTASWFDVFDTATTVIGYAESQQEWDRQMSALHEDLRQYHQLYDIYNRYSGVTNLRDVNEQAGAGPVSVDARILSMLAEAQEMYTTTNGKMNIAFGAVLRLWHNYREAAESDPAAAQLPPMAQLQAAGEHCSIGDLILDQAAGTVAFGDPELQLDVGSVGKGYAVEMAAQAAQARGLKSAIISVGGNLRTIGHKPDGSLWSGGIQNPWTAADPQPGQVDPYLCAVELEDLALVTSGNYQRYYTVDGKRYHHLIDPDTLMPAGYFSAVAVLGPDSGLADCLSTGLFCMSLQEGQALVESLDGVEAMWMLPDESVVYSAGFEQHLKK